MDGEKGEACGPQGAASGPTESDEETCPHDDVGEESSGNKSETNEERKEQDDNKKSEVYSFQFMYFHFINLQW